MYSPVLNEKLVRTLYRVKRSYKRPMTEIAGTLIQQALQTVDVSLVCRVCKDENINDCSDCCLQHFQNLKQEGGE